MHRADAQVATQSTATQCRWKLRQREIAVACKRYAYGQKSGPAEELVQASGSPDKDLAHQIARGFDLMGTIPTENSFPQKLLHATLTPGQVREMSSISRPATWQSTKKCMDKDLASEVHRITLEECERGWLKGPFSSHELPDSAILTRRFGVKQSTTWS